MTRPRPTYFLVMSLVLLGLMLLGFAPSFYLRAVLPPDTTIYPDGLPLPHVVHGVILTGWYALLVLQTRNVRAGAIAQHRTMGWIGAALALLVLASTAWVVRLFPDRIAALATARQTTVEAVEPGLASILWLDGFMGAGFAICCAAAVLQRRNAAVHKRLMLYAGIAFIFAAVFRLGGLATSMSGLNIGMPLSFVILLALTASLPVHDRLRLGRVLPVTWLCFGGYWSALVLSQVMPAVIARR